MADPIVESSVQRKPAPRETSSVVLRFAQMYDRELPEWWSPSRDAFLRDFWPQESILSSAIYSISARNAAFGWELSGLKEDVEWGQRLLQFSNFGGGWQDLITKTTIDFTTQDNGAAWEIIRPARVKVDGVELAAVKQYYEDSTEPEWFAVRPDHKMIRLRDRDYKLYDRPLDAPIGIAHLDAGRVWRTGNPDAPAIYTDIDGRQHLLRWWQVVLFSDMQSPIEEMNGVGTCAVSRAFRYAHTLQSLSVYKDEKLSGRFTKDVHITNADPGLIQDQIEQSQRDATNIGLQRYSQPVIASTFDPGATPQIATISLASMPDGFNEETALEWYVSVLALALGVDYGFLAPLPGKGLGTASQSETMARQARGKSSRLFMDMTANAINFRGILPESLRFRYIERDTEQELAEENVKAKRAETRGIMIKNGEISPQIARQIASDDGDLAEKYLNVMGEENLTPGIEVQGDDNVAAQEVVNEAASAAGSLVMETEPMEPTEPQAKGLSVEKEPSEDKQKSSLVTKISDAARKAFGKRQQA